MQVLSYPTPAKLFFDISSYINLVEELGPETLQICVQTSLPTVYITASYLSSYCYITAVFREQMEQLFPLIMFHLNISEQSQSWRERVKEFVLDHTFYKSSRKVPCKWLYTSSRNSTSTNQDISTIGWEYVKLQ